MRRICHVQETPGDVEAVVLNLTTEEHDDLHRRHEKFVNDNKVFTTQVKSIVLRPEPHPKPASPTPVPASAPSMETWMVLVVHRPACTCVGTCTPL